MNFQSIKLQQYLLLFSLTFILTCEDKNTYSSKFGAVHVEIVFNNDNSQNNKQSTNNRIKSFLPKKELFRTIGKNNETDEVAEENIHGLHTEKDENNSVLNKSLSDDITSITITISGVDPVNVDVSSGETVSKTIDGVPVGQQTIKIDLKNSAGTIIYTQTQTVEVAAGETSSPSFPAEDFTPENLSITVTSPNGGETWQLGTTHDITWNSSHSGLNVKIELYKSVSSYQTISSSQTNDGSYSWAIPSSYDSTVDYKIRISYVSDGNVYDDSDNAFSLTSISQPTITVTSPNGGETWELGSTHDITWSSADVSGNVKIELYKSGSSNQIIAGSSINSGSYTWAIPIGYEAGGDYTVRISSVSDGSVYDGSDNAFSLTSISQPTITVTSPNGGETWELGSTHDITWSSADVSGNVKIELYKAGSANQIISGSTSNSGSYSWTIPTAYEAGSDYTVRISSISDATVYDESDNTFTLSSTTQETITVTSPNGGEEWEIGSTYNLTWTSSGLLATTLSPNDDNNKSEVDYIQKNKGKYLKVRKPKPKRFSNIVTISKSLYVIENVKIELYQNGSAYQIIEGSTDNDGSYSWTIPSSYDAGTDYKVRISSVSDATVYDESDANFTLQSPAPPGNYSVSFDYMDGYASSDASSETIFQGVTSFTVEVWYKNPGVVNGPNSNLPGNANIVTNYRRIGGGDPYNNFNLSMDSPISSNTGYITFMGTLSNELLDDDQWHHLAGVYDHDNSVSYLFIDGVLNDTGDDSGDFLSSYNKLYINNHAPFSGEYHMECDVAGLRITDGVRYSSNFSPSFPLASEANSIIALDFSTGDGTTLADLSGNGNNFSLYDAASWTTDVPSGGTNPPMIAVTSPNGGESWQLGTTQDITWSSSGVSGNVKIELYQNGSAYQIIEGGTDNDGSYSWTIPSSYDADNAYRVRISSVSDASVYDDSDGDFSLSAPPYTITSPNGSEDWELGSTHDITWTSGDVSGNIKIELYQGGSAYQIIEGSTDDDGSYSWTIPETYDEGTDYKVRISSVSDATVYDESDANFTLQSTGQSTGNYSLSFDGADDYVEIENSEPFNPGNSDFSITTWIKIDEGHGGPAFISKRGEGPSGLYEGQFYQIYTTDNGNIYYQFAFDHYTGNPYLTSCECLSSIDDNEWHFVATVFDRDGYGTIYLDGDYCAQEDISAQAGDISVDPELVLGYYAQPPFQGLMDETSFWMRTLSPEEINEMYSNMIDNDVELVAHWNFDEGSGTTLTDQSSNGNNGTIYGATWSDGVQPPNYSLSFDGVNANNVEIDGSTFNFSSNQPFTIGAWINSISTPNQTNGIVSKMESGSNGHIGYSFELHQNGELAVYLIANYSTGDYFLKRVNVNMNDQIWHYVTVSYDGSLSDEGVYLYIDGNIQSDTYTQGNDLSGSMSNQLSLRIGSRVTSQDHFHGDIDEVAIWNEVLTVDEVSAIYNSGNGLDASSNSGNYTSSSNLQGYWKFNEGTGTSTADGSTNSNAGTISGATWSTDVP